MQITHLPRKFIPNTCPENLKKKNPDPDPSLVEPMQYLFVRILKARGLAHNESPVVDPTLAGYQKGSRIADPVLDWMNQGLPCLKLQVKMKKY